MAESLVAVTPGAGKNLHTFNRTTSAGSVEDEVVLLGENYLASYTISDDARVVTTAASHPLQVMAGASLKVRIRRIEIFQSVLATAASLLEVRLYRLTTAGTGGGALVPQPLEQGEVASGATAMTLPTAKGTEAALIAVAKPYLMQTLAASAQLNQPIVVWDFDRPRSKSLVINAGAANGIAIKNVNAVAGASIGVMVWLDESSF